MTDDRHRKRSSGDSRLPPFSLEAEASFLGAILLSPAAVEIFATSATASDFYKAGHQHIAHAVAELHAAGTGVDVVTVAERLRSNGLLDDVGGTGYLLQLQNATPAVTQARAYARIVVDTSRLRRLLGVSAEIAELVYGSSGDPSSAIARAEELVAAISVLDVDSLSTLDDADVGALLDGNLEPEQASILVRSDGGALIYPGKMHVFQAEPSSGKSWIALVAVAEVLAIGGSACYLDFEDTPTGILRRLLALGASPAAIRERFYYTRPLSGFGPAELAQFKKTLDRMNPDLVVIDGVGEALSRQGFSEDKADDVVRWTDLLPRMIARTGAAVLMLDHVAKDPEQRGRWARGSGAKLAVVDGASYQIKVRRPFSRHRSGEIDLIVAKDRPGGVGAIGEVAAKITVDPSGAGERVSIRIDPKPVDQAPTDSWKPTVLMAMISKTIAESTVPLTATGVLALVHAHRAAHKNEALARLISEGYVAESSKRPRNLSIVRPYHEEHPAPAATSRAEPPPPELDFEDDLGPTEDEIAEIIAQDPHGYFERLHHHETTPDPDAHHFYNSDTF